MANQDFNVAGALKVRPAEESDATHLHTFCFPEKTETEVMQELQADLESDGQNPSTRCGVEWISNRANHRK